MLENKIKIDLFAEYQCIMWKKFRMQCQYKFTQNVSLPERIRVILRLVWTMEFFMFTIFEISWFLSARGSVLQVQAKIKIFS